MITADNRVIAGLLVLLVLLVFLHLIVMVILDRLSARRSRRRHDETVAEMTHTAVMVKDQLIENGYVDQDILRVLEACLLETYANRGSDGGTIRVTAMNPLVAHEVIDKIDLLESRRATGRNAR